IRIFSGCLELLCFRPRKATQPRTTRRPVTRNGSSRSRENSMKRAGAYAGGNENGASWRAAALVGAGLMAGVDEIVFHQILQWHQFYDHGTPALATLTDGLLHALELMAIGAGGWWLLALAR